MMMMLRELCINKQDVGPVIKAESYRNNFTSDPYQIIFYTEFLLPYRIPTT